jgi:RNA recognition motif-containing protein
MNIRVTNLSLNILDSDIRRLFSRFGEVNSAMIIRDKNNGRPNGSALIDMVRDAEGLLAIESLNQTIINGKAIIVTEIPG